MARESWVSNCTSKKFFSQALIFIHFIYIYLSSFPRNVITNELQYRIITKAHYFKLSVRALKFKAQAMKVE